MQRHNKNDMYWLLVALDNSSLENYAVQRAHSDHRLARFRQPLFSDMEMQALCLPQMIWAMTFIFHLFPCT